MRAERSQKLKKKMFLLVDTIRIESNYQSFGVNVYHLNVNCISCLVNEVTLYVYKQHIDQQLVLWDLIQFYSRSIAPLIYRFSRDYTDNTAID